MEIRDALKNVLTAPEVKGLWTLRAELLEADLPEDSRVWSVVDEFQQFLVGIHRRYSILETRGI